MSTITKPAETGSKALRTKKVIPAGMGGGAARGGEGREGGPAHYGGDRRPGAVVLNCPDQPLLPSHHYIGRRNGDCAGEITLDAYRQIISGGVVTRAVLVSVGVTVVGTLLSMVVSVLCAYGLSRPGSFAHTPILFTLLLTMFFSAGMIPAFLLVSGLGLINTYWALILPSAISVFNIIILRGFFMGIDRGILDSARIDGASEWRILFQIVLPMSKAVTAVISLFYGVGYWNAFFNAVLYINDSAMNPLQVVLRSYVLQGVMIPGQIAVGQGQHRPWPCRWQ
ncbi:carbohydrate ABC transporter permease [Arthrobacter sp. SA17]